MKVYSQEIKDGLGESIVNDTTVAFCSPATLSEPRVDTFDKLLETVKASSNPNQIDLYYLKSVLV